MVAAESSRWEETFAEWPDNFRWDETLAEETLESYLLLNNVIDTSVQKGFLSGINGVMEHILSVNALLENARSSKSTLASTFIDLKNAFGSVSHTLLQDMLLLVEIPPEVSSYIHDMYSKLTTTVETKDWFTPTIKVCRGLF